MNDTIYPLDAARVWLTALLPVMACVIEEASDASVKASMDSAYPGGWTEFAETGYKLVFWPPVAE